MDGDTLLTEGHTFPYSDKEIELVCGSLVTIRKGTLQVIHLTVKEFLRSRHGSEDSSFSSLLIDPDYGNLQLTLVCLRCIATNTKPLVDLKSEAKHIDWGLDTDALDHRQAQAPLLQYASFSWLMHFIECKLDDMPEVILECERTFNSATTFSWVETCMTFQPDSTLRLLVGFDEVRDKFCGSSDDLWPPFLGSWCTAMSQVFEEYGAILARRPWEIYFIDMCHSFSADSSLQMMWQEHGETLSMEKVLYLNEHRDPRPPQEKPQPHLQLQQSLHVSSLNPIPVFLVHDERQNIYIWGETRIVGNSCWIAVQHDGTGQSLPPATGLIEGSDQTWWLNDCVISPNGMYLALSYRAKLFHRAEQSPSTVFVKLYYLTLVWQIDKNISFRGRMNCESWARVIFSHAFGSQMLWDQSRAIIFSDDHRCITPSGMVDLRTGDRKPLPDGILGDDSFYAGLFYSCSGRYLFATEYSVHDSHEERRVLARRFDTFEPSLSVDFPMGDKMRRVLDVSPTGLYLVLGEPLVHMNKRQPEDDALYLYNTESNETSELRLPEPLRPCSDKFHFSHHETKLIAFLTAQFGGLRVIIWDCLATHPRLRSFAYLGQASFIDRHQIHVHKAAGSAVIVSDTNLIQRIELSDEIKFPDEHEVIDDYPHRLSNISRDGVRWVLVSYGQNSGKVQIIDITSHNAPARHFDLDWSQSDIPSLVAQGYCLPISLSPDLRVLIINSEVFDITINEVNGASESSTLTSFTIEGLPTLLEPHQHKYQSRSLKCKISPCNSYVIYVGEGDQWCQKSRYLSAVFLYRIDLQKRTSVRLELDLPEGSDFFDASFHPSLPVLTIRYALPISTELMENDLYNNLKNPPMMRLAIFDLEFLKLTSLEIPSGQYREALAE